MNESLAAAPALILATAALAVISVGALRRRPLQTAVAGGVLALIGAGVVVAAGAASPLNSLLLLYTTGVVVVVAMFSRRHLDGDMRALRYSRAFLLAAASAVLVVVSGNLAVIAVAWIVTGLALGVLLGHHDEVAATASAVRAWRVASLVADGSIVVAVGTLIVVSGGTSLQGVTAWAAANPSSPALPLATVALFVAAATRSGLWPFSGWLVHSVVAPAPVSALLHAGIVNAPVVLLLALQPVWGATWGASVLLALLGFGTALVIFPRKLVRPDVKTRLAWSTSAQLGFMIGLLSIGAPLAAIAHMVLHGAYKASAFLGAGEHIGRARLDSPARSKAPRPFVGVAAGTLAATALVAMTGVWEQPVAAVALVVAFAAGGLGFFSLAAPWQTRLVASVIAVLVVGSLLAGIKVAGDVLGLTNTTEGALPWVVAGALLAVSGGFAWAGYQRPDALWIRLHRWAHPDVARRPRVPATAPTLPASVSAVSGDERVLVREQIRLAAQSVPPSWSWRGFVASNPLLGLVDRPFADAVTSVAAGRGWATLPGLTSQKTEPLDDVDHIVAGWLAAWTDDSETPWPAPRRTESLWSWFRTVATHDPVFSARARSWLQSLPVDALDVVVVGVKESGEPLDACEVWLRQQLLRLRGWSGFLGRRDTAQAGLSVEALTDLLAVRSATRLALQVPDRPLALGVTPQADASTALAALGAAESAQRVPVLIELAERGRAQEVTADDATRADADLVFCIDPRSERIRRHVEALGNYRTVGFAGFFGFAVERRGGSTTTMHHPVLLPPAITIERNVHQGATVGQLLNVTLSSALNSVGGGFAAVEVGALRGLPAAARTIAPSWFAKRRTATYSGELGPHDVESAAAFVQMTGTYGPSTAPLVVLTGHGSTSVNNPTESAFDCGACGGQRGALNAQVAAATLNDPVIRARLAERGFAIPHDSVFVAAEHDTATDEVLVLSEEIRSASQGAAFRQLTGDLRRAGHLTTAERAPSMPLVVGDRRRALAGTRRLSADWATVRHEWGLAGNALFIAAPRPLTRGMNLQGRAFLHDYDASSDADGTVLETILTAPLVVAQWINAQYFFSASDPQHMGSGSKTAHNPVGGLGALAGASGDLLTGLPEQSVRYNGELVHEPLRLLVVVAAEPAAIQRVLAAHPSVEDLVVNEWLTLCSIDVESGQLHRITGVDHAQERSVLTLPEAGAVTRSA